MLPEDHLAVDRTEEDRTEGCGSLKTTLEILSTCEPVSGGNTIPTDLISTQPVPAAVPAEAALEEAACEKPQCELLKPICPQCGLEVPDHSLDPLSPGLSRVQGSGLSMQRGGSSVSTSRRSKKCEKVSGSQHSAAAAADSCWQLLWACLWCQGSVLLLGLLEACCSCLGVLCSSCCHACARCCSAIQETPVEELNCHAHCHSVMFESCCEPTECLEFCVDCCEICHRS
ncbi:uncharacterized protein V6R79_016620 [Siganus canaliculatus]